MARILSRGASLPLEDNQQTHDAQHRRLHPRVLREHNRDIADKRHKANDAAHNVLALEVVLVGCVEVGVVGDIVVALCEKLCSGPVGYSSVSTIVYFFLFLFSFLFFSFFLFSSLLGPLASSFFSRSFPQRTPCQTCARCGGQSECPCQPHCTPQPHQHRTPGKDCGSIAQEGRRAGKPAPWNLKGRRRWERTSRWPHTGPSRSDANC